jgi:ComF family protein
MPVPEAIRLGLSPLLELLFPTRCVGCGASGTIWCAACQARLVRADEPVCLACRRRLAPAAPRHRCPPDAPRAWAFAIYRPPLDRAVTYLKYRPDARLIAVLAGWLAEVYRRQQLTAACVVPVPLGRARQRQRGYNQAELLGRALAERLRLPVLPTAATRLRETASQVGLEAAARWANVDGAFGADPSLVRHQTVLLVDDVHTTGATLAACAQALAQAGARRVLALTIGRA